MEGIAKLITLMFAQPLFVATGLLLFGTLVFIAQPVWRIASKRLERRLESDWEAGSLSSIWYRVEAFALIVHCVLAFAAAVWCAFWTDYPAPGIGPAGQHPFGPEVLRIWGYSLSVAGGCIALIALILRSSSGSHFAAPVTLFRHLPRVMMAGIAASIAYLAYAMLLDPSLLGSDYAPQAAFRSLPWLYCWVAFMSMSMSLLVYLPLMALRALWRLAASIP